MGELILGRADDGTLLLIHADDEIEIQDDLLEDIPAEGAYRLEGKVLKIEASGQFLAYVLTEHDRLTNTWRAVRTADHEGR
jgi:hypothetical protein